MTKQSNPSLEKVLNDLGEHKKNGTRYMARCPAHNDKKPSLSISEADGKILVHCFAGCETKDVLDAAGLSLRDLYPDGVSSNGHAKKTEYEIQDSRGNLIATHHRVDMPDGTKNVWWTDADGNKSLPMPIEQLPLYGIANLAHVHKDALRVVLVEGEKAATTLQKNLRGYAALVHDQATFCVTDR